MKMPGGVGLVDESEPIVDVLSFDIEDWFHMVEIEAVSDPGEWPGFPSLVEKYTHWILETLAAHEVKATFFVLGWIAERYPALVKAIGGAGHEVAAHSWLHRRVDQMGAEAFGADLKKNVDLLEQLAGQKILGFRAPSFSIVPGSEWAFDVMHECGIAYDSSLFPAARGHGGYPCRQEPHLFDKVPCGKPMPELPLSVMAMGPVKLAFSGGGYLRLLPEWAIRSCFRRFHKHGWPVVTYLHPRDFAVDCPRVPMPIHRRFKSYVGLRTTASKLLMMLREYRFVGGAEYWRRRGGQECGGQRRG
jgi:polysaccharide deacetylase family protein (PEP-CTERM system associated)